MRKTTKDYWDDVWSPLESSEQRWDPRLSGARNYWQREVDKVLRIIFKKYIDKPFDEIKLVELGAANSLSLPYFAKEFGFQITGIDYSRVGCEKASNILEKNGVEGEILCSDFSAIPEHHKNKYGVAISFGVIEHFTNPDILLKQFSELLEPGGLVITLIPNMRGLNGFLQKLMSREIYEIHVAHTLATFNEAHIKAGFDVIDSKYLIGMNTGVVNIGKQQGSKFKYFIKRVTMALLVRVCSVIWWMESKTNRYLPKSAFFSPYLLCVAKKRG